MKIIKDGNITINNTIYKFKIFDTDILIDIIRHDKKLAEMLETNIRIYRNQQFKIFNLVKEYITYRPDSQLVYFIIYNNKEIISLCRFYYYLNEKYGYFNMVYTTEKYRNKKICQNMIAYIIKITKKYIHTYELEVDNDNIPAIKCYESNGFYYVKKINYKEKNYNLMRLIV